MGVGDSFEHLERRMMNHQRIPRGRMLWVFSEKVAHCKKLLEEQGNMPTQMRED